MRQDGRCPECGTPVGLSTQGDWLRFASPDWLDKVALGLKIILWMVLVGVILGVVGALIGRLVSPVFVGLAGFASGLISFYGVWLITEPDPSGIGEDPNITARKVVRIALVIGLVSQPINIILQVGGPSRSVKILLGAVLTAVSLVWLVGEFAKFIYFERLARRIPDNTLADRARVLKWGYTITLGFFVLGGAVMIRAAAAGSSPAVAGRVLAFGCVVALAAIAFLGFAIMTLTLLVRLRRAIAEQARLARIAWEAAMSPGVPPT